MVSADVADVKSAFRLYVGKSRHPDLASGDTTPDMSYTYILKTSRDDYYVGSTDDIIKRVETHNAGKVKSTKNKLPVRLVFKEYYSTRSGAQKKEYKIKNWKSRKMIERLIELGPIV